MLPKPALQTICLEDFDLWKRSFDDQMRMVENDRELGVKTKCNEMIRQTLRLAKEQSFSTHGDAKTGHHCSLYIYLGQHLNVIKGVHDREHAEDQRNATTIMCQVSICGQNKPGMALPV
jgi:hypothetical protein